MQHLCNYIYIYIDIFDKEIIRGNKAFGVS